MHHDLPHIITSMHASAFESYLIRWQFNGLRYLRARCAWVDYADETGDGPEYEHPHIIPESCSSH